MRIVSGQFKGRRINPPKNLPVRPTKDMSKEALFNILNNRYYFDEISVLDLFSGTGSISYEFASRGSQDIIAVDNHSSCVKFIQHTAEEFSMPISVQRMDSFYYLESTDKSFDVIFADPPYDLSKDEFSKIPEIAFNKNRLNANGLLILEHSNKMDLSDLPNFQLSKNYGGSVFSFFGVDQSTEEE